MVKFLMPNSSFNNWVFWVSVFFRKSISFVKRQLTINLLLNNSFILSITSSKEEHLIGKLFLFSSEFSSSSDSSLLFEFESLSLLSLELELSLLFDFEDDLLDLLSWEEDDKVSFFLLCLCVLFLFCFEDSSDSEIVSLFSECFFDFLEESVIDDSSLED